MDEKDELLSEEKDFENITPVKINEDIHLFTANYKETGEKVFIRELPTIGLSQQMKEFIQQYKSLKCEHVLPLFKYCMLPKFSIATKYYEEIFLPIVLDKISQEQRYKIVLQIVDTIRLFQDLNNFSLFFTIDEILVDNENNIHLIAVIPAYRSHESFFSYLMNYRLIIHLTKNILNTDEVDLFPPKSEKILSFSTDLTNILSEFYFLGKDNYNSCLDILIPFKKSALRILRQLTEKFSSSIDISYYQKIFDDIRASANSGDIKSQILAVIAGIDNQNRYLLSLAKRISEINEKREKNLVEVIYGYFLIDGKEIRKDPCLGAKYIKMAAGDGNAEAQFIYSLLLHEGIGTRKNVNNRMNYLRSSADLQFPVAACLYGESLLNMAGAVAKKYLSVASEMGIWKALIKIQTDQTALKDIINANLHFLKFWKSDMDPYARFLIGLHTQISSPEESENDFRICAQKGIPEGICEYARILDKKGQLHQLKDEIQKLAGDGYAIAKFYYAKYLCINSSSKQISETVSQLYHEAANAKVPEALYEIGVQLLPNSKLNGIMSIEEAAKLGSDKACFYLGGTYATISKEKAIEYFKMASITIPESFSHLGSLTKDIKYYKQGAIRDQPDSCYKYGKHCMSKGNYDKAIKFFKKGCELKYKKCFFQLAECLRKSGSDKFPEYYQKAADINDPHSFLPFGICMYYGIGTNPNKNNAYRLFSQNSKLAHLAQSRKYKRYRSHAVYNYEVCQLNGFNGKKASWFEVFDSLKKKIVEEEPLCLLLLGLCNLNDLKQLSTKQNTFSNQRDTLYYFQNAAKHGHPQGVLLVGYCFEMGIGVKKNEDFAIDFYMESYKFGCQIGFFCAAMLKTKINSPEGEKLLKECADNEKYEFSAKAQFIYGSYLIRGNIKGISVNLEKGIEYVGKAVKKGLSEAEEFLGRCYLKGNGIPVDGNKAISLFKSAAEKGNMQAMNNLAYCLKKGMFIEQSHEKAADLWLKAGGQSGNPLANLHYGMCCMKGRGVKLDMQKAIVHLTMASIQGIPRAIYAMALYNFQSCKPDIHNGLDLLQKAANKGYHKAICLLNTGSRDTFFSDS